ncbi:exocyst complex component 5 [Aricia agestis]|uniref:exocyst complex component 5 n=1 Tax=Aricia agestis TaxID=91739 RepID=UPI001C20246B|nr:exocyst complex component 5 [Aricia agestis]XP_041969997.1 exocyst complex component 5 [Aricia agestis]
MMNQYLRELEQDPFDPDEFVERMVRRSMQESRLKDDQFDPEMIHDIFTQAIQDLKVLQERQERKCARLEQAVQEEEKVYLAKLSEIMDQHTHCVNVFSSLDERMSRCGGRALDIGEKLGAARAPRARSAAARDLLSHLANFLNPGPVLSDVFNDPNKLNEAADVIQKLYTIAQELPPDKFDVAKNKIETKYDEIERNLIEEFVRAQNQGNVTKMKDIASIMTNFKGYSQCVDAYIETSQMNTLLGKDIFSSVLPLCKKNYTVISSVFPNPDQVMSKFVLNIFHLKLQKYVQTKLADKSDIEKYLRNLYEMYTSIQRVSDELVAENLVSADGNASTGDLRREALINGAMAGATEGYPALEIRRLKAILSSALNAYYAEKQHVKKQIQGGGFQELRRDLQAVIGTRANINIAQIENYGGETFLSEQLARKMLSDAQTSFLRCRTLCTASEVSGTTIALLEVLIQQLLVEHVDYALDLGLQSIPIAETKSPPQIYFFDTVNQANKIVNMFIEHFQESVLPCMSKHSECVQRKNTIIEQLETKLDLGLERAISAVVGWVKLHLHTEQKKSDFKPDGDIDTIASPACLGVVSYLSSTTERLHAALEGDNRQLLTLELAVRLHRVIYDHLQNFTFNSAGAMIAICDVKEYRSAVCGRGSGGGGDTATALFDALHALCNLLLVKPENLHQVCEGETLAELDHSILLNFIQLRSDYKTHKLSNFLKGLTN